MSSTPSSVLTNAVHTSITQSRDAAVKGVDAISNLATKLPSPPDVRRLPLVGRLPATRNVIDAQFAVVDELLSAQKTVAYKVVDLFERTPA